MTWHTFGVAALMLALSGIAYPATALERGEFPGGRYVSGGVGSDEQEEMQRLRPTFNLRILTAQKKTGEFLSDARVVISRDASAVADFVMSGPLALVQLPAGSYSVRVTLDGKTLHREVSIGRSDRRELYLYFD